MKYKLVVKPYRKEDDQENLKTKLFPNHFVVEFTNLFEFDGAVADHAEEFVTWYRESKHIQILLCLYQDDKELSNDFILVAKELDDHTLRLRWESASRHVFQAVTAGYKHAIQDPTEGDLFKIRIETVNRHVVLREEQGIMMTFRHGEFLKAYRSNAALVDTILGMDLQRLRIYRILITHPYETFLNRASVIQYKVDDDLDTRLTILNNTIRKMLESIDESMDACYRNLPCTKVWTAGNNA